MRLLYSQPQRPWLAAAVLFGAGLLFASVFPFFRWWVVRGAVHFDARAGGACLCWPRPRTTVSSAGWRGLIRCSMTLCGRAGEVAGECLSGKPEGGRLGRASVGEPDDEGPAGAGPGLVGLPHVGVPVGGRVVEQAAGTGGDGRLGRTGRRAGPARVDGTGRGAAAE